MRFLEQGIFLEDALAAFDFGGEVAGALRLGKGHINDTFAVYTQQPDGKTKRFVLQRINTYVFKNPEKLMENIVGVTAYLRGSISAQGGNPDRETLTVVAAKSGSNLYKAPDGGMWRCYLFIEDAVCYQKALSPAMFQDVGSAFGKFTAMLKDYPAHTLHETIPDFHNTPMRIKMLADRAERDEFSRSSKCREELEFALSRAEDCGILQNLLQEGRMQLKVTHNDTKLNNIMIDNKTGKGICVVDLDTVMPGLIVHDFGDAIRFGANTASEDEKLSGISFFSMELYESYARGFLEAAGSSMTALEKQMMPWGARIITLELGIRFLTDYLDGDRYFKSRYPDQNLYRCRTQFKLVSEMEQCWERMNLAILNMG